MQNINNLENLCILYCDLMGSNTCGYIAGMEKIRIDLHDKIMKEIFKLKHGKEPNFITSIWLDFKHLKSKVITDHLDAFGFGTLDNKAVGRKLAESLYNSFVGGEKDVKDSI